MFTFLKQRGALFTAYYLAVSLSGYVALWFWFPALRIEDWLEYAIFVLMVVIADLVNVTLPHGGASISVSTPITFAAIVLLQAYPAAWLEAISAIIVEGIVSRRPFAKVFFNVPVLALSTGLAGMVFQVLPFSAQ